MFNFVNILIFSYLLPFIFFLFLKKEIRARIEVVVIIVYSLTFFLLIKFQDILLNHKDLWNRVKDFFFPLYTFTELLFFSIIYWINIKTKAFRILSITISTLFVISQIIYYNNVNSERIDSIPVGLETLIMYIYIFYFFYNRFKNIDNQYIYNNYCFWVSIGIMIYLGGSFFLFILGNHISQEQNDKYWYFTFIVEIAKNILFAISLLVFAKQPNNTISKPKNTPYLDFN